MVEKLREVWYTGVSTLKIVSIKGGCYMPVDNETKKVAEKHVEVLILSPNVYWQTAMAVVDVWRECLCRIRQFENAHKIMPFIDEKYNGNICELEIERDEYRKLVDLHLSIFDLVCVAFGIESISFGWLEENLGSIQKCKRFGVDLKDSMYHGCEPKSMKALCQ